MDEGFDFITSLPTFVLLYFFLIIAMLVGVRWLVIMVWFPFLITLSIFSYLLTIGPIHILLPLFDSPFYFYISPMIYPFLSLSLFVYLLSISSCF